MKLNILIIAILIFINCTSNKNPIISYEDKYNIVEIERNLPYLFLDSDNSAMILFGQDNFDCNEVSNSDGEFDKIIFTKYNSNGDKIINNKQILTSIAIIDMAIFAMNIQKQIVIIWLDPRNNQEFIVNHLNTYYVDVYYKIIDTKGNTVKKSTKLTNELIEYQTALNSFKLNDIYYGTMKNIKTEEILCDTTVSSTTSSSSWIEIDSKQNEHHFRKVGRHWDDSCKIIYKKIDKNSNVIIEDKELIKYEKLPDAQWSPVIQNMYITIDDGDYIHCTWQLNDGKNYFSYYYLKLHNAGKIVLYDKIGEKYQ